MAKVNKPKNNSRAKRPLLTKNFGIFVAGYHSLMLEPKYVLFYDLLYHTVHSSIPRVLFVLERKAGLNSMHTPVSNSWG